MANNIVTCVRCGRQFNKSERGYYLPQSRRYVCKYCASKEKSAQAEREKARKAEERKAKADEREKNTGMRQSVPAMIVKIAAGVVVFASSCSLLTQGSVTEFVVGVAIAAGLAAWGLVPYLKAKKAKRG